MHTKNIKTTVQLFGHLCWFFKDKFYEEWTWQQDCLCYTELDGSVAEWAWRKVMAAYRQVYDSRHLPSATEYGLPLPFLHWTIASFASYFNFMAYADGYWTMIVQQIWLTVHHSEPSQVCNAVFTWCLATALSLASLMITWLRSLSFLGGPLGALITNLQLHLSKNIHIISLTAIVVEK